MGAEEHPGPWPPSCPERERLLPRAIPSQQRYRSQLQPHGEAGSGWEPPHPPAPRQGLSAVGPWASREAEAAGLLQVGAAVLLADLPEVQRVVVQQGKEPALGVEGDSKVGRWRWGSCHQPPPLPLGTPTYLAWQKVQLGDSGCLLVQARQLHTWRAVSGGGRQRNNEGRDPPAPGLPKLSPVLPVGTSLARCQAKAEHPRQHPAPAAASVPPSPAGIHQAAPTATPRVRTRLVPHTHGGCTRARLAPALRHPPLPQQWGHGPAEAPAMHRQQGGVWHAPARPHSPDWSRLLRR